MATDPNQNETDPTANAGGEDTTSGEPDALSEFLGEFSQDVSTPKTETDTDTKGSGLDTTQLLKGLQPVVRYVESEMDAKDATVKRAAQDKEIGGYVDFMAEDDALKDTNRRVLRGFLEASYSEDPEFKTAYDNRSTDSTGWQTALGAVRTTLAEEEGGKIEARSDVEAAVAAVKGVSPEPAPPDDAEAASNMFDMSDQEFETHKRKLAAA